MKSTRFGVSVSCLAVVVVLGAAARANAADTTLRWKFVAGQKFVYGMIQKTAITSHAMDKKVEMTITQTMDMSWEIKSVGTDGTAEMVQTIDRIKLDMSGPAGNLALDTADAQDPQGVPEQMSKLIRAMAGAPFTAKVSRRGEFLDVKLPPKLLKAFEEAGPMATMFGGDDGLKKLFEQSMLVFPEEAISQGKSWKGVRKMPMPLGSMVINMTYTLLAPEGSDQKIGVDAKIEIEANKDAPVELKVTAQEMKGHYRFDNTAGILKSTDVVQKMTMTVNANGQQIDQDVESTVKLDLKKNSGSK